MSDDKFGGSRVGFSHQYPRHVRTHEEAKLQLMTSISAALAAEIEPDLPGKLAALCSKSFVSQAEQEQLLVDGWISALDRLLSEGALTADDQRRLLAFAKTFDLSRGALNGDGAVMMLAKAKTLAAVMHGGEIPDQGSAASYLPPGFLQDEHVVWVFRQTRHLEDTTRRLYVEGKNGVSVHVVRGVYYHASSFKGHPVEHRDRVHVDTGACVATSKHLRFVGSSKTLHIPYSEIVSFYPFSNGVGVMREAASAKLQVFATGDGWFTYNVLTNLARF